MRHFPRRQLCAAAFILAFAPSAQAGTDDTASKPKADFTTCAKPVWPPSALQKEQQGAVTLSFRIDVDGTVGASKVLTSSGYPLLDSAAQDGIAKCRFKPAQEDGKPVQQWMKMQYVWTLEARKIASTEQ